jgi:hypothetical protein
MRPDPFALGQHKPRNYAWAIDLNGGTAIGEINVIKNLPESGF